MTATVPSGAGADATTLDPTERKLLFGVCVIIGAVTIVPASYNYVLNPMLDGLGATESQSSLLRQIPSIAGLLVVFLAGVIGGRWSTRRVITGGCVTFTVGSGIVAVAPLLPVASAGLVLQSIGMSTLWVVALALLSAQISSPAARATAFSTFAIVKPVIYLVAPVVAGLIIDSASWRLVPGLWTVGGVLMVVTSRRLLTVDGPRHEPGELLTPALAGLVLALVIQTVNTISSDGWTSSSALLRAAGTVLALVALGTAHRRMAAPSLSLAALRQGGVLVLLVVIMVIPFANLWYYLTVGLQQVFELSALETALALVPAQIAGIVGAVIAGAAVRAWGVTAAGTGALVFLAAAVASTWVISASSPVAVPVVVACLFGLTATAVAVPLTNAIMDSAPPGEEGSASSFRGAAGDLGNALGVVLMTTLTLSVVGASLTTSVTSQGLDAEQSADIASSIHDGASSEMVASEYAVPVEDVDRIDAELQEALVDGVHALGTVGAVLILGCAGMFLVGRRRQGHAAATRHGANAG